MTRGFTATVWQEGEWFIARCGGVEVASQGLTAEEALMNLREALELHFEPHRRRLCPEEFERL